MNSETNHEDSQMQNAGAQHSKSTAGVHVHRIQGVSTATLAGYL